MLDKELEESSGKFKVHRQDWRSADFNELMDELDLRAMTSQDRARPRMTRDFGNPCKASPPDISRWIISTHPRGDEILAFNSPDMFDD